MKEKVIDMNWKNIGIVISDLKEEPSSENRYFTIHLDDKDKDDITKYVLLHIWFSLKFLQSSPVAENINFDEIINEEINNLLMTAWDNFFDEEEYFVFYKYNWRIVNERFHPFIEK